MSRNPPDPVSAEPATRTGGEGSTRIDQHAYWSAGGLHDHQLGGVGASSINAGQATAPAGPGRRARRAHRGWSAHHRDSGNHRVSLGRGRFPRRRRGLRPLPGRGRQQHGRPAPASTSTTATGRPTRPGPLTAAGELRVYDDTMCLDVAGQDTTAPAAAADLHLHTAAPTSAGRINADGTIVGRAVRACAWT